MRRRFQGLSNTSRPDTDEVPDGMFLARIEKAQYRWHAQKPYYIIEFSVVQPNKFCSRRLTSRLHCTPKALWKLSWFLRDFGYDSELFAHDEIEDKRLIGLQGVIKVCHVVRNGSSLINLEAFAPAAQWNELSLGNGSQSHLSEVAG